MSRLAETVNYKFPKFGTFKLISLDFLETLYMYNPKKVLWENMESLLIDRYGSVAINKFHNDSKISKGTISRIKLQESAIGLDVIHTIATFFGLQTWQMLVPMLDPKNPPVFCISKAEQSLYERMKDLKYVAQQIANSK